MGISVLKRLLLIVVVCLTPLVALSAPRLSDEFDPNQFTPQEIRILQRSLTFLGHYQGLWDKEWGPVSQNALAEYAESLSGYRTPINAVVVAAILEALEVAEAVGWTEFPVESAGVSFGIPEKHVEFVEDSENVEFEGPQLLIRLWNGNVFQVRQHHRRLMQQGEAVGAYEVRRQDRYVTSVRNGLLLYYSRSDFVQGTWVTLQIEGTSEARDLFGYVTSSFDTSADFDVNDGDLENLVALFDEVADYGEATPEPSLDRETNPAVVGSGTGFFVTPSHIVTNAHVVNGCASLRLGDGDELSLVSIRSAEDLALLYYDGASPNVLSISPTGGVNLGETVSALGYPLYGLLNRQLNFTQGVVSALTGLRDNDDHFTLTAPIQPGNSGGPIIDRNFQVVGVAAATANVPHFVSEQGFTPQNINWAIKIDVLRDFLSDLEISFRTDLIKPNTDGSLPTEVQRGVVPILCHQHEAASDGNLTADIQEVEPMPEQSGPEWYLATFAGLDFYGGDINPRGDEVASLDQCQRLCAGDPDCRLYTYNTRYNICFIKQDYTFAQSHPDAQSGLFFPSDEQGATPAFPVRWKIENGSVFSGDAIRSLTRPDYQACILACDDDENCSAFSYLPGLEFRQCQLFSASRGTLHNSSNAANISGQMVDTIVRPTDIIALGRQ